MQTQAQVLSVTGKNITTSRGPGTVYEIAASDGRKYSTFDFPLSQQANALLNQFATIEYEERVKGQYVNYDLKGISAAGQVPMQPQPNGTQPPVQPQPIPVITPEDPILKERRISMLSAFNSAAEITASLFQGAGPEAAEEAQGIWFSLAKAEFEKVMGAATPVEPEPAPVEVQQDTPPAETPAVAW